MASSTVLRGHSTWVLAAVVSRDGHTIFSSCQDATIRKWQLSVDTGAWRCTAVIKGHREFVGALALSPAGERLFSGSGDNTIRIWRDTGETVGILKGHTGAVNALVVSVSGGFLFSGSGDHTLRIWRVSSGTSHNILRGHTRAVQAVAVSECGMWVYSGGDDRTIRKWKTTSGECVQVVDAGEDVRAMCISGDTLLAGGTGGALSSWSVASGVEGSSHYTNPGASVNSLAVSPAGGDILVFSAGSDGKIGVVWLSQPGRVRVLAGHGQQVTCLALAGDGWALVSASMDATVRLWDTQAASAELGRVAGATLHPPATPAGGTRMPLTPSASPGGAGQRPHPPPLLSPVGAGELDYNTSISPGAAASPLPSPAGDGGGRYDRGMVDYGAPSPPGAAAAPLRSSCAAAAGTSEAGGGSFQGYGLDAEVEGVLSGMLDREDATPAQKAAAEILKQHLTDAEEAQRAHEAAVANETRILEQSAQLEARLAALEMASKIYGDDPVSETEVTGESDDEEDDDDYSDEPSGGAAAGGGRGPATASGAGGGQELGGRPGPVGVGVAEALEEFEQERKQRELEERGRRSAEHQQFEQMMRQPQEGAGHMRMRNLRSESNPEGSLLGGSRAAVAPPQVAATVPVPALAAWLHAAGLGPAAAQGCARRMAANSVGLGVISEVSSDDLKEMGVPLGHRLAILRAARVAREGGGGGPTPPPGSPEHLWAAAQVRAHHAACAAQSLALAVGAAGELARRGSALGLADAAAGAARLASANAEALVAAAMAAREAAAAAHGALAGAAG